MEPHKNIGAQKLLGESYTHAGSVRKQGGHVKTWRSRYLIIHKGCLYYFDDFNSKKERGAASLLGYNVQEYSCPKEGRYGFQLCTESDKRNYYFIVPNERDRKEWIDKLQEEMNALVRSTGDGGEDYDYCYQDTTAGFIMQPSNEEAEGYQSPPINTDIEIEDFSGPTLSPSRDSVVGEEPLNKPLQRLLIKQNTVKERSNRKPPPPTRKFSEPVIQARMLPGQPPVPPARPSKPAIPTPSIKHDEEIESMLNAVCGRPVVVPRPKPKPKQRSSHLRYEIMSPDQPDEESDDEDDEGYLHLNQPDGPKIRREPEGQSFKRSSSGGVPVLRKCVKSYVGRPDEEILPKSVYQLDLDRETAQLLLDGAEEGTYLIRKGTDGLQNVLMTFIGGKTRNYKIFEDSAGQYYLKAEEPLFTNLGDLIRHYLKCNLPTCASTLIKPYT